jgi:DNA-binding NarL/FixJ family response regulator
VATGLAGRATELDRLAGFLAEEQPDVAVLEGEAGIGKTALWRHALALAAGLGMVVLSAGAFEGEAGLAFAALADLVAGIPDAVLGALPKPQRLALEGALLLRDDADIDPRAIATAFAAALRALPGPALVAVDDAQWLDESSAAALAFAVRRLPDAPVRFLLTRRGLTLSSVEERLGDRLLRLPVGPLDDADVLRLLDQRRPGLRPRTARHIVAAAGGNPLFALELGGVLARDPGSTELPASIAEVLDARLAAAPPVAVDALRVVALSPGLRTSEAIAAVGLTAVTAATDEGLLVATGEELRPSHPLLGTAVLARSPAAERQRWHQRLAGVLAGDDRHLRHRALATERPDRTLAEELAAAAARATRRGERGAAVELAWQAFRLTPPDSPDRPTRRFEHIEAVALTGDIETASRLALDFTADIAAGPLRARAWLLLADCDPDSNAENVERFARRAFADASDDAVVRAGALDALATLEIFHRMGSLEVAAELAERADALGQQPGRLAHNHISVLAWTRVLRRLPIDDLVAAQVAGGETVEVSESLRLHLVRNALWAGRTADALAQIAVLRLEAEERAEAESGMYLDTTLGEILQRTGDWDGLARLTDGWRRGRAAIGLRFSAGLALGRGEWSVARRLAEETLATRLAFTVWNQLEARRFGAVAALMLGDTETAAAELTALADRLRTAGVADPGIFPVAGDLVEALCAVGDTVAAEKIVAELASVPDHPWAQATTERGRGRLLARADPASAAERFQAAAASYAALGLRPEQARCLVDAGAALRRARRIREARAALTAAVESYRRLGSPGWVAWAQAELDRLGGRRSAGATLTPGEQRVAELVASGLRNREVAATLMVTESTVEATLSRVYAKLGLRSRTELAKVLAATSPSVPSGGSA